MNTNILGKQVLQLPVKRSMISGTEADRTYGGMGAWLTEDKRTEHYKRAVDRAKKEYDEDNIRMDWFVFAVCADGTYILRSEFGYERSGIDYDEFEIIKDGKVWGE